MNHASHASSAAGASADGAAPETPAQHRRSSLAALALGAVGVVFGDIGTSPLYTMKEAFGPAHGLALTHDNVLGVLSLVFWSLMSFVTLKYVALVMRADNRGEGGIMALMSLVVDTAARGSRGRWWLMSLGMFGAALFYGDSMITPAISVLSAVEGLSVATPVLDPYIVPITLAVIVVLFVVQFKGTGTVGALFGPITLVWFLVLAVLGVTQILRNPHVLLALNPAWAAGFFLDNRLAGFLALGAVVLAVTGAEALYADMGHFGRAPIRLAWFAAVFPALVLNYFGQGALLLSDPTAAAHPFFRMAPGWALYPLVALATVATVIASQAVISGAYSLTRQAIQLGYCPRLTVRHTSEKQMGQVYMPWINWALLVAVLALVLGFGSSSALASAYGIAVTGTMAIDTILLYFVIARVWRWGRYTAMVLCGVLLAIDLAFLCANSVKVLQGGWFPLAIAAAVFLVISTWRRGRELLFDRLRPGAIPVEPFLASITAHPPQRVPGTAVFLTAGREGVPHAMLHNLSHNKVLHERVVLLTVLTENVPYVEDAHRVEVSELGAGFYRMSVRYGFKDDPDLPRALTLPNALGLEFEMMETSFFLSRQTIVPTRAPGMALWREKLFAALSRNSGSATEFFHIPTNRVVELGTQIEI
ncbi:MAG: potassium transporter Kup [Betaproteobacteria bacterium]|jgi:KUP system potassium uptake protein|nr:potassium transporter Kup [Rhodocyclaceae bacterium]MCA3142618.1 potassium transporter Kup [Rhodocyclaceae bacterium]MCA3144367.1 potassium transporter Kup [Rhodocyclaceae bacterium]